MKTFLSFILLALLCIPASAREVSFHVSNDRYSFGYSQRDYGFRDPYVNRPRYSPDYVRRVEYYQSRPREQIYVEVSDYHPRPEIRRLAYRNPYLPVCVAFDRYEGVYYEYYC